MIHHPQQPQGTIATTIKQIPPEAPLLIGLLREILSCFQDAFTFTVAIDVDLVLRALRHLDTFGWIFIKLIASNGRTEDALDLSKLLLDRRRTVVLV